MANIGAAARPVLSFSPNWAPILTGDSVTLTCNGARPAQGNERYTWYKSNTSVPGVEQQNYTIQRAQTEHSGRYQCQNGTSERSAALQLTVRDDKVILQAPPGAHEGEELTLRCYTRPEYNVTNTTVFYKNKLIIRPLGSDSLVLGGAQTNMSGSYSCQTKLYIKSVGITNKYSSPEEHLSVTELFSPPQIKVRPDQVTEGDHMTITCDTKLHPHRNTTELQFAFYRNETKVQEFSSSYEYRVLSFALNYSGNYTCEVQTSNGSVRKRSSVLDIPLKRNTSVNNLDTSKFMLLIGGAVALVGLISLLIVALCILKSKNKLHRTPSSQPTTRSGRGKQSSKSNRSRSSKNGETNLEEEVCYISINHKRKGHSAAQNNDDGNNVIYAAVRGNDTGNAQAGYKQRENSVVYAALKTPKANKIKQEGRKIPQVRDEDCVYASVKKR
uniref:Ig-like domain-containing protein n=1 Tax=Xenopus tropicalis TaxID=8364 RepID=A0A803K2I2_XENTR